METPKEIFIKHLLSTAPDQGIKFAEALIEAKRAAYIARITTQAGSPPPSAPHPSLRLTDTILLSGHSSYPAQHIAGRTIGGQKIEERVLDIHVVNEMIQITACAYRSQVLSEPDATWVIKYLTPDN